MATGWDHYMARIRTRTNIDRGHEARLRKSVSVLRGALGEEWVYRRIKVRDHSSEKPGIGHLI